MPFEAEVQEHERRKARALAMGGPEKLAARRAQGWMNARERIDYLLDPGTFVESGLFGTSIRPEMRDRTPADGKIAGYGKIDGRWVAIVANDFTVLGASSAATNGRKIGQMKRVATARGLPLIFLGESTGARMPDVMGAMGMGAGLHRGGGSPNPTQYLRTRETPWVSAILGYAFGSSAWYAAMSDCVIFRKGSVMAVSSPRLAALATRATVDPEELGGWRLHATVTGQADVVVDTDAQALDAVKRFLSYLPSHNQDPPPVAPVPDNADTATAGILSLLPEQRSQVYDMRRIMAAIADPGSIFELKGLFGRTVVTALGRIDGQTVGFVANNPLFKGGAVDADGSLKVTSFLVLCDSFNIPIVFLVDQPGFLVGLEVERRGMPGKVINWMNALSLVTVPKIMVIVRKSYGQAYLNMGGGGNAHEAAAWWTADVSFMDPASAATIVYGVTPEQDPEGFAAAVQEMHKETSAYDMAAVYGVYTVIDPRDTRHYLKRMLRIHRQRMTEGIGAHRLANWPTSY